jgi:membrane associated rhomboid family serine protease
MMKRLFQAIGSQLSGIAGQLFFIALFVALVVYQVRQGHLAQAAGGALLVAVFIFGLAWVVREGMKEKPVPMRLRVGDYTPPRTPAVFALLAICIVATFLGWAMPHHWYIQEGTVGRIGVLQHHEWWRLITSMFLHANPTHLYFNMFALWILGRQIESNLGAARFLAIYFGAGLGGGLIVVAAGQENTLGASGAIYGLMGAALFFGIAALRAGHRKAAKGMLLAAGALIAINLLFTFSVPNISMAVHAGGLVTGFLIAAAVGTPAGVRDAWALTDRCAPPAYFTYDVTVDKLCYHGPAHFAVEAHLTKLTELASNVDKHSWPQFIPMYEVDPAMLVDCEVEDPTALLDYVRGQPQSALIARIPQAHEQLAQ